jgi:hypothetical protein
MPRTLIPTSCPKAEDGLSQTAIVRIWRTFGLQPYRVENFSCPRILSLLKRSGTSSGCIRIRRAVQWCCAWMRRAKCRRSTGLSRFCR